MGHNVSSNKVVVSKINNKDSTAVSGKRNINNGVKKSSAVAEIELDGSDAIDAGVACFKRMEEINVKVKADERMCDITGCCLTPDGCLILTDFTNRRLKKLNRNKNLVTCIELPEQLTDVCSLGKGENVVTCGGSSLYFVNTKGNMKLQHTVILDHVCNGLTVHGDNLYILDNTSVFRYTCTGERKKTLYTSESANFCHISSSYNGEVLYITDETLGLHFLDKAGNLISTLADGGLKQAQGVCMDLEGNVLVSGFESDTVIKVDSMSLVKFGTVIRNNGDISDPKCLCVDSKSSLLYVGQWNDGIAVFDTK